MSEVKRVTVSSRRPLRTGEWACVDAKCAHINAEKRTTCEICSKSKPRSKNRVGREIGKDAADKSKGLFSADDWVCTKCGNVNWARRSVCNVCNAPKLADVEVRTGYGGGYMDRQDVEYIERDDDEEFDEFGRKKRRRNKEGRDRSPDGPATTAESKTSMELQPDDDDNDDDKRVGTKSVVEDEEEDDYEEGEDDDDGDLDKYDLTADPELVAFQLDAAKLAAKSAADDDHSGVCSDCSCSCSGGECSCEEEEEQPSVKKPKADDERRRSTERSDHRADHHERSERRGDGAGGDHRGSSRSSATAGSDRWRERGGRGRSSDRDHRDRDRDRHRDYHR